MGRIFEDHSSVLITKATGPSGPTEALRSNPLLGYYTRFPAVATVKLHEETLAVDDRWEVYRLVCHSSFARFTSTPGSRSYPKLLLIHRLLAGFGSARLSALFILGRAVREAAPPLALGN